MSKKLEITTKFEKIKDVLTELAEHNKERHVYIKKDGYCYRVKKIYVDDEGDLILEAQDEWLAIGIYQISNFVLANPDNCDMIE